MMSQPSAVSIGGGDRPILPASHQAPSRASSSTVWSPQLWRSGEKDNHILAFADAVCENRSMDKCPATAELPRKECGVFVFGRHDRAVAVEAPEIAGHREGDQRPGARVSGVRDGILIQRREVHDARVLPSPQLLRVLLGRWGKGSVARQFASW